MPDICVAVITYRRPELLQRALRGILRELESVDRAGRVVVVDNDPERTARDVVAAIGSTSVEYLPEPTPGIPAARNAALDSARDCRLLAFIDDDAIPEHGWLQALIQAWEQGPADAVAGPNVRVLDEAADAWVAASGFFGRSHRRDGAQMAGAPTSNLLLDMATITRLGLRFDQRFATTGGSDTLFTRQLTARGGVIRWCERAMTTEPTPPERATRDWVLARERRVGNTWSRVHLALADTPGGRVTTVGWLLAISAKLAITGLARRSVGSLARNLAQRSLGERETARASGVLMGVFGGRVHEYERGDRT